MSVLLIIALVLLLLGVFTAAKFLLYVGVILGIVALVLMLVGRGSSRL
jgi:hypothetical protein